MNKGIPAEQIQEWIHDHIDNMVAGRTVHGDVWYYHQRGRLSGLVNDCKDYATKENFTKGMIMAADKIVNRAGSRDKMECLFYYKGQKFYHMTAREAIPRAVPNNPERNRSWVHDSKRSDGSESVEKDGWLAKNA